MFSVHQPDLPKDRMGWEEDLLKVKLLRLRSNPFIQLTFDWFFSICWRDLQQIITFIRMLTCHQPCPDTDTGSLECIEAFRRIRNFRAIGVLY